LNRALAEDDPRLTLPSNPSRRRQKAMPEHGKELSKRDESSNLINATPEKYREFKNPGDAITPN
jgi:hypothetical protein